MGDFRIRKINDADDRKRMYQYVINDINVFEQMLANNQFQNGSPSIGAEQELCILKNDYTPATSALQLLESINDAHYTNELALFNLEINLDPFLIGNHCFSDMENSLLTLLKKGRKAAKKRGEHILMAGILPSLKYRHLQFEYMTPMERYRTLSQSLFELRGTQFEIYLQGVDELILSLESVLFEACNTSFQLHLQIRPEHFVSQHNWAQMITGPVLAAAVNSPLLFGNELWAETRIALFKQSIDTRSSKKFIREKLPRVYFGKGWLQHSAAELWKNDLTRFPLLVTSDDLQDAHKILNDGKIPDLRAIRLHNGTTYTWNRMIYGYSKKQPHLRIECRYLPAGPSAIDEMANFAFWVGLMNNESQNEVPFWNQVDFKEAKDNFIKAARTGLNTVFHWFGKNIPAKQLILEQLLPMAQEGLEKHGIPDAEINKYLSIIERRVTLEMTGSAWTVKNFRKLSEAYGAATAQVEMCRQMIAFQKDNIPVHEWHHFSGKSHAVAVTKKSVEHLMSTDILCIQENDSLALARSILSWNDIHHLPVENINGNLVGLITDGMMERLKEENSAEMRFAKDIMLTKLFTIQGDASVSEAKEMMDKQKMSGLPVVYQQKLIGLITNRDLGAIKE